jgi:hypothetical protein
MVEKYISGETGMCLVLLSVSFPVQIWEVLELMIHQDKESKE